MCNMQLAIELPDELGKELLKQGSVNEFVQEAIKKMLQEQQQLNLEKNKRGEESSFTCNPIIYWCSGRDSV